MKNKHNVLIVDNFRYGASKNKDLITNFGRWKSLSRVMNGVEAVYTVSLTNVTLYVRNDAREPVPFIFKSPHDNYGITIADWYKVNNELLYNLTDYYDNLYMVPKEITANIVVPQSTSRHIEVPDKFILFVPERPIEFAELSARGFIGLKNGDYPKWFQNYSKLK